MPTKTAARHKERTRKRVERSGAEKHLRQHLANTKRIKDIDDTEGLYRWLCRLDTTMEDHRSQWEKDLQEKCRKELKLK